MGISPFWDLRQVNTASLERFILLQMLGQCVAQTSQHFMPPIRSPRNLPNPPFQLLRVQIHLHIPAVGTGARQRNFGDHPEHPRLLFGYVPRLSASGPTHVAFVH